MTLQREWTYQTSPGRADTLLKVRTGVQILECHVTSLLV